MVCKVLPSGLQARLKHLRGAVRRQAPSRVATNAWFSTDNSTERSLTYGKQSKAVRPPNTPNVDCISPGTVRNGGGFRHLIHDHEQLSPRDGRLLEYSSRDHRRTARRGV